MHLPSNISIKFAQVTSLLAALPIDDHNMLREKDLVQTRSALVIRCFHRLVEKEQARNLLDLLDDESKKLAKSLGSTSFSFTRNNARWRPCTSRVVVSNLF